MWVVFPSICYFVLTFKIKSFIYWKASVIQLCYDFWINTLLSCIHFDGFLKDRIRNHGTSVCPASTFALFCFVVWHLHKYYLNVYRNNCHYLCRYVGKLVGRYYDSQGNPTKYLKGVEAKAKRGAQLQEKQKIEEAKQPSCSSKWSQDEGGEVYTHVIILNQLFFILLTGVISPNNIYVTEIFLVLYN